MKRSLAPSKPSTPVEGKWNYQDDMLASSMVLVTMGEGNTAGRFQSKSSDGNLSSTRSCGSGGTLHGSMSSSKSCKVDLCAMNQSNSEEPSKRSSEPASMDIDENDGDDWGFFVD